jgi:hypothetical protein
MADSGGSSVEIVLRSCAHAVVQLKAPAERARSLRR